MASNSNFILRTPQGWKSGLNNLLSAEFSKWRTKEWYSIAGLWTAIISLSLVGIISQEVSSSEAVKLGVMILGILIGMFPMINIVIILQDEIIGARETGTLSWIMSKPVSRSSYILSKFISYSVGIIFSMAFVPMVASYIEIFIFTGVLLDLGSFFIGLLLVSINSLFYISLTLMLGVLFDNRGGVIGIPLAFGFGYSMVMNLPLINQIHPMAMFLSGNDQSSLFQAILNVQSIPSIFPIISSILAIIVFLIVALWKFQSVEL